MGIYNKWLTPYQRSYQQIKQKLIESLMGIKDKDGSTLITDYSEGNVLIIIISLFAAIAEVLHFYIDNTARESFLATCRKYDSVRMHGRLVDYHPSGAVAATVDVILLRSPSGSSIGVQLSIPSTTQFNDDQGNTWYPQRDVIWDSNVSTIKIPLIQHERYTNSPLNGMVIPSGGRPIIGLGTLPDGKFYEKGTMELTIGGESWVLVDTFAYSKPTDKHFMVDIDADLDPYIMFGDGVFGAIPQAGASISNVVFYLTSGIKGNVPRGSLHTVPSNISSKASDASLSNPYQGSGGSSYESFDMLKEHIPLSVKTLGVAITKTDFEDLAKLVPGIKNAKADYECGRKLTLYVSGDNGVIVSEAKIQEVLTTLKQKAPLTTWLSVKTAGQIDIMLEMDVTGKKSYKRTEIQTAILQALLDKYSPNKSEIGGSIRISDIYALIDNLPQVDYLHITKFYTKPWPKTLYGNSSLIISDFSIDKATGSMDYYIQFNSTTSFTIRPVKNGNTPFECTVGQNTITDINNGFTFSITVDSNNYKAGYRYQITVSEPNLDYVDPGFNVPVFVSSSQLKLIVNETL